MSKQVVEVDKQEIEQLYLWHKKQWKLALDAGEEAKASEHHQRAEELKPLSEIQYKQAS